MFRKFYFKLFIMRQIVCSNMLFNQTLLKFVTRSLQDVNKMNFTLNRRDIKKREVMFYVLYTSARFMSETKQRAQIMAALRFI